jgi:hypothetical protein
MPKGYAKQLEVDEINLNDTFHTPCTRYGKDMEANVGHMYVQKGFGFHLYGVDNKNGGVRLLKHTGTAKEMHYFILGLIDGFQCGQIFAIGQIKAAQRELSEKN